MNPERGKLVNDLMHFGSANTVGQRQVSWSCSCVRTRKKVQAG